VCGFHTFFVGFLSRSLQLVPGLRVWLVVKAQKSSKA
jgi:hypothetical protein